MNLMHEWIDGAVTAAEARMPRVRTWSDDFAAAMTGESPAFWADRGNYQWDAEQQFKAWEALRRAYRMPGATPAERWAVIDRAMRAEAARFADAMADERGDDPADTAAAREFEVDE